VRYLFVHFGDVARLSGEHIALSLTSLAIAAAIAVPLGVFVARVPRASGLVTGFFGAVYTIPSLAMLGVLVLVEGLGFWTAVTALAAYAQMILIRNVAAGVAGVDRAAIEAARGMGMNSWQLFWRVERPLAMPVIIAGVRIAAVSIIGIATVAAWVNAGGLGTLIFAGIDQQNYGKAAAGAIAAVVLALAADGSLRLLERSYRRHLA
jgi:osmoprotectant transport system permease protein